MRRLERLWRALEDVPGQAAVAATWKQMTGAEYGDLAPFLRPLPEPALCYPRLGRPGAAPYRVVRHGPDDVVGVDDESGETVVLAAADLVVYRADPSRLIDAVAAALGFERRHDAVAAAALPWGTFGLGVYRPTAGYTFPAYLVIAAEAADVDRAVSALAAAAAGPLVLLAPTDLRLRSTARAILERIAACFVPLCDAVGVGADGRWTAAEAGVRALEAFRGRHVPIVAGAAPGSADLFPTPPNATWRDLRVRFLDGETLSVAIGSLSRVVNYTQMGLADRRNGRPTKLWHLLKSFAEGEGLVTWRSPDACRQNQKRRERLAAVLKGFFRIVGESIELTSDGKGWRTAFRVESYASLATMES